MDGGEIRVRVAELESQQQRRRPFASRGPSAHHSLSLAEIHRQRMQQTHQPHSAELSAQLGSGYAASHPPPLGTSTSPHHLPPIGKVRRPLCLPQHHHHYPPAEKIPLFHAPEGMTLTMVTSSAYPACFLSWSLTLFPLSKFNNNLCSPSIHKVELNPLLLVKPQQELKTWYFSNTFFFKIWI